MARAWLKSARIAAIAVAVTWAGVLHAMGFQPAPSSEKRTPAPTAPAPASPPGPTAPAAPATPTPPATPARPAVVSSTEASVVTPVKEPFPLEFEKSSADVGEHLETEQSVHYAFKFVNRSTRVFKPVVMAVGGRTAVFDRRSYEPGESGVLMMTVPIRNRDGRYEQSATISDASDRESKHVVRLSVIVIPVVKFELSGELELPEGAGGDLQLFVTGLGGDFEITGIKQITQFMKAEIGARTPAKIHGRAATRTAVTLRIDPDMPSGSRWQNVSMTTNRKETLECSHAFKVEILTPLIASASRIVLLRDEGVLAGSVELTARDSLPFTPTRIEIESTSGPSPSVEWKLCVSNGRLGIEVTAWIEASTLDTSLRGTIKVYAPGLLRPMKIPYVAARPVKGNTHPDVKQETKSESKPEPRREW